MNKIIFLILLLLPLSSWAGAPCSGKKVGISHCNGTQFVCNDGSTSKSTKDCSSYIGGKQTNQATKPTTKSPVAQSNTEISRTGNILKLDYPGYTVWLDCSQRGAVKFQYVAQRDNGNAKRYDNFFIDPNVPVDCQQTSAKAYGHNYDRGHQVPANHLDASEEAIKSTNTMTNILPQAANMNRGAWLQTEEIIECYRDISELLVIGGVLWGNNPADDYFIESHGVKTPDAFWKVVIRGTGQDERAIAWIVPNSQEATRKNLDQYLISVDEIERVTGEKIPVADYAKHDKPSQSWMIPVGCNKG
ncbi:DNA/RNA non-specific endonuclease [Methylobacter sp.]|uniref:DNA/RNA non-specific endonuclease n=1 Tax=Methylobacter sp. TaxID=2051955 RepID=UPI0024888AB8|nr:DNA/RNA non-specific endonuclease [Methylobacter sp.]MDI1276149.1 DNA/RNA non-specific endonuclease [Methylobacter sp.]MDI1356962.1 DNA/RNA non-specific endonuclease [Methylobacter sp.]